MKNKIKLGIVQPTSRATIASARLLPLQSAPVSRRVVNSAASGDVGLEASDWNDNYEPTNYYVHIQ